MAGTWKLLAAAMLIALTAGCPSGKAPLSDGRPDGASRELGHAWPDALGDKAASDGDRAPCVPDLVQDCDSGQKGACKAGSQTCVQVGGGWQWSACKAKVSSQPEICSNGIDDDCDGQTDTADSDCVKCTPSTTSACDTGKRGPCKAGTQACVLVNGVWQLGACTQTVAAQPTEICGNGIDDDCNGQTDTADPTCVKCSPSTTQACDTGKPGPCKAGTQTCVLTSGVWQWGACNQSVAATNEICANGIDDNCSGQTDEAGCTCPSWTTKDCTALGQCPVVQCNNCPPGCPTGCDPDNQAATLCPQQYLVTAWCTRSASESSAWMTLPRQWVEQRCGQAATLVGGAYYTCNNQSECVTYTCGPP